MEKEQQKEEIAEEVELGKEEEVETEAPKAIDEVTSLKKSLEKEKERAEEYLDQWRRARADLANYKRRTEQEREELLKFGNALLIAKVLPVLDDFERAIQTVPRELLRLSWLEGVVLIQRKLEAILDQEGVKPIEAQGKLFDPNLHQAVLYEDTDEREDGEILAELQTGYMLHDKVLRPSLVKVASARKEKEVEKEKKGDG